MAGFRHALMVAAAAVAAVGIGTNTEVGAAATIVVARFEMDEAVGSTVLIDSSGNNLHGSIGDEVVVGGQVDGAITHRFKFLRPNTPPAHPGHLDRVEDNDLLDPGTKDYAVTMRVRWTHSFGNMIQKGQSRTVGGYFKWEATRGIVKCMFRGSKGEQRTAVSKRAFNDGVFHVIRCERTSRGVFMTVDGERQYSAFGSTGSISNIKPLSIAGKSECDQITVTCDYFVGEIDYVIIETS